MCKFKRRGKNCPKVCHKFRLNGLNVRIGCRKGENCNDFHQNLCKFSLQNRVCTINYCKHPHTMGTRLKTTNWEQKPTPQPNNSWKDHPHRSHCDHGSWEPTTQKPAANTRNDENSESKTFLWETVEKLTA